MNKYILVIAICALASFSFAAMDTKSQFEQGMEAFKSGNYGSSELLFKKVKDTGEVEYMDQAWFHMALSIHNKKKYESALFEFKNFLNNCKNDDLASQSRYWMGECYFFLEDYSNAIEEYRRFISRREEGELIPNAHDRIGFIYLRQKRYDEAILEWQAAVTRDDDSQRNIIRQLWIGEAFFNSGKYDESLRGLIAIVYRNADAKTTSRARMVCGRIYQEKNIHQKALHMFNGIPENLMDEEPFNDTRFFQARSYRELGNTAKARTLLDAFIFTGRNSQWYHDALFELGTILVRGADSEYGLTLLEKVRTGSKKPELVAKASNLIGSIYQERQPEKAIPYLKESLAGAEPGKKNDLIVLIGKTCMRAKKYDEAIGFFDLYLQENPFEKRRDEVNFIKARAYFEKGNIDTAIRIFEAIRTENPFSQYTTESGYYLGLIEHKKGNPKLSISLLQEYIKRKNPANSYEAHALLAHIYLQNDDLDKAGRMTDILIRDFISRQGVEISIKDYALALQRKGRDGTKYINLITTRFPESATAAEVYLVQANLNFDKGKYDSALNYFGRYLADINNRSRGEAFYKSLFSLYRLKRYEDVIDIIKKGNFPPMNENQWKDIPLLQARSFFYLNKFDEVYMLLDRRDIRDYPHDDIIMYIRCALRVGDQRSAMETSVYLEADKPVYSEALYIIGDYFLKNDNIDQAEMYFLKLINECAGSKYVDHAKVSLGEAYARNKKFQAAVNILSEIVAEDARDRKNSLLIACYFDMNLDENAIVLTREHLDELLAGEYGQEAVKYNLNYYYRKKDLQQFDRYVKYLNRYGGNEFLINYLCGKLYFEKGHYHRSHHYFRALARTTNRYYGEALYHLGIYDLFVQKRAAKAISYFSRIVDLLDVDPSVRLKAMIHLAIIYKEQNDNDRARTYLKEVLVNKERGLFYIQAGNLYEKYGYSGM